MTARARILSVALALVALTAQAVCAQAPAPAQAAPAVPGAIAAAAQVAGVVTVEATPNPAIANDPITLRISVSPGTGPFRYEFYIRDARLTECGDTSPECVWTTATPGEYGVTAVVIPLGLRGRRGGNAALVPGRTTAVVRPRPAAPQAPEPAPEPAPPPAPEPVPQPAPQIAVGLLSPRVVVGEPARFSVLLLNVPSKEYAIDMGDGVTVMRTEGEFTYTFTNPGSVEIVASYPVGTPTVQGRLVVEVVEAAAVPVPLPVPAPTPEQDPGGVPGPAPVDPVWVAFGVLAGLCGLAAIVWVLRSKPVVPALDGVSPRPGPVGTSSPPPEPAPAVLPVPTFHPRRTDGLQFASPTGGGIRLEVRFACNSNGLRFTPRIRISQGQS